MDSIRPGLHEDPLYPVPPLDDLAAPYARPERHSAAQPLPSVLKVLEEIDYGVMLVTGRGQLRLANPAGLAHCGSGGVMLLDRGVVQPSHAEDRPSFQLALEAVAAGRRSMLVLRSAGALVPVATVPLSGSTAEQSAGHAVILFGRDSPCEAVSLAFYAAQHGLTSAETVVLGKLCQGLRPAQIAARSGVSVSTVRSQIKSIRLKTGSAGTSELLQTVARLPPMLSAVNRMHWSCDSLIGAAGH